MPSGTAGPPALEVDVVVVGAGPAGSAAATALARAGRSVALVDKARFPRDKCCGDGLTTGALRRLAALGLDPGAVTSWSPVEEARVRSPSGRCVSLPLPGGGTHVAVARRRDLDAALVELARRSGATVLEGNAVSTAHWEPAGPGPLTLGLEGGGSVRASFAVGADGAWSSLRRLVGASDEPGYLGEWHAFRRYFKSTGALAGALWVWFEPELLPGYAWSFPLAGGVANVGFGLVRRPGLRGAEMGRIWEWLLQRSHVADVLGAHAEPEGQHRAWPIPARLGRSPLCAAGGRVLFVGDAARAADPMTGEGIAQALETSSLAAGAILAAGPDRPGLAASRYRRSVCQGLYLDNRLGGMLANMLRSPLGARGAVRVAGSGWAQERFVRWMFEDGPRAMALTPWRWPAGRQRPPPPYG
ncbi:MAG: NAD(P)/FAD-dependent oxidoreductase [Acidimicrobiales bacterium]